MGIGLHQARFEPAFPQGAGSPMPVIHVRHVAATKILHRPADALRIVRRQQQVNVIGHQHIGMDGAVPALHSLRQPLQIDPPVVVLEEDRLPIVAPLHDMGRHIS
jgi:hypothetical protein